MANPNSYHRVIIYELTTAPAIQANPQLDVKAYEFDATPTNIIIQDQPAYPAREARTIVLQEVTDPFEVTSGIYPAVGDVDATAAKYGPTGTEYQGTLVQPAVSDVLLGVSYGADGIEFTGTLAVGGGLDPGTPLIDPTTGKQYIYIQSPIIVGVN
jgi:hypothetical protein